MKLFHLFFQFMENIPHSPDEDGFIPTNHVGMNPLKKPTKSYFLIDHKYWYTMKLNHSQRRFKGLQWTTVIGKGLRTIHPYCSFAFKCHLLRRLGSQGMGAECKCQGYCQFEDCPVTVTVTVDCEKYLKAKVLFTGSHSVHN